MLLTIVFAVPLIVKLPLLPPHVLVEVGVTEVIFATWLTNTVMVALSEVHPLAVCFTLYVPAWLVVREGRVTGEPFAVYPAGPFQERLDPVAESVRVFPVHSVLGEAVSPVGTLGLGVTLTATSVVVSLPHVPVPEITT